MTPTTAGRSRLPHRTRWTLGLLAVGLGSITVLVPPPPASAEPAEPAATPSEVITPRLTARAAVDATDPDHRESAGFVAAVADGSGAYWALPGGEAAAQAEQLLRLERVRPRWERASGGRGGITVTSSITLSDPYGWIDSPIRNEGTRRRQLTQSDFDPGSLQRGRDGSWWIGDTHRPVLLHVSRSGRVVEPAVSSSPAEDRSHGGFAAMARSADGRYLYPVLEQATADSPDLRARTISEFDTWRKRYTDRRWIYRTDTDANRVSDAQLVDGTTMMIMEQDGFAGPAAFLKRVYRIDLDRQESDGVLAKKLVVDLLKLDNPDLLGPTQGWGRGREVSFGHRSVEAMVLLRRGRILLADSDRLTDPTGESDSSGPAEMIIVDPRATAPAPLRPGVVYAHRGASGYRPEHTLASYALAIRQCADVIEPDVVMTSDGVPLVRHENEIGGRRNSDGALTSGGTTDVDQHPEFADRLRAKSVDGDLSRTARYWYTDDFTLAELRTLRAKERLPEVRPDNTVFNGLYPVPTLAEVLDLARHSRSCTGGPIAVAPETKHPSYFAGIGLPVEPALLSALTAAGLNRADAPVIIQSFETQNLKSLAAQTDVRLIQLINCSGRPWDFTLAKDKRTYADLAKPAGLAEVAGYADAVGFCKNLIIPRTSTGALAARTTAVADAHAAGLQVVGWTFRRENQFLPLEFRSNDDPDAHGDLAGEITAFLQTGMDGYFTDNPDVAASLSVD